MIVHSEDEINRNEGQLNDSDDSRSSDLSDLDEEPFDDYSDEDAGPPERELEEKEFNFGESQEFKVTFKTFLQEDEEEFESWMTTIHVRCICDGKDIGGGKGRYVDRNQIRQTFWRDMEEPCQELSSVAFGLFDRHGRLKQEFMNHTVRKGTGVWGSELDLGSFFVIEIVRVDRDWRRKGIAKKFVDCFIEMSRAGKRDPAFSLVAPGWLNHEIKPDLKGKTKGEKQQIRYRV